MPGSKRRTRSSLVYGPYQPPESPRRRRHRRTGTEPLTAHSDLPLRRVLSRIFAPLFILGAIAFAFLASRTPPGGTAPNRDIYVFFAALCAGFAVIALIDLIIVARRIGTRRDE